MHAGERDQPKFINWLRPTLKLKRLAEQSQRAGNLVIGKAIKKFKKQNGKKKNIINYTIPVGELEFRIKVARGYCPMGDALSQKKQKKDTWY